MRVKVFDQTIIFLIFFPFSLSFGYAPEISRKSIAGIWKLTNEKSLLPSVSLLQKPQYNKRYPMKEFTVYPKKMKKSQMSNENNLEMLLFLKEDGSFVQYSQDKKKVTSQTKKSVAGLAYLKGTWDYLDGKLILATDRPENADPRKVHDTVLSGKVSCIQQNNTNHVLKKEEDEEEEETKVDESSSTTLKVKNGSIKVGKFMYPKQHPSFFDQPIFQPTRTGSFTLSQVLGSEESEKNKIEEKYTPNQFYNKVFRLTSVPLKPKTRKPKLRWSKSEGKYVPENYRKEQKILSQEENKPMDIRIMKIKFFSNHTFCTIPELQTEEKILRGKWNLLGDAKDQIWFQVWRFGFGRSVSGSTFSEGKGLTQDDARMYWGSIKQAPVYNDKSVVFFFEIRGSVLLGSGLEPLPIAKFTMNEIREDVEEQGATECVHEKTIVEEKPFGDDNSFQ